MCDFKDRWYMGLDDKPLCPSKPLPPQSSPSPAASSQGGRSCLLCCVHVPLNMYVFSLKLCRLGLTDLSPLHKQVMDQPAKVVVRQKHIAADLLVRLSFTSRTRQRTGFRVMM